MEEQKENPKIIERKLAIIQDALEQLNLFNYHARAGTVVGLPYGVNRSNPSAQEELTRARKEHSVCRVCARGALLLSKIYKENEFATSALDLCKGAVNMDGITDRTLSELFSIEQLALIEEAFEFDEYEVSEYPNGMNKDILNENEVKAAHLFSVVFNEYDEDEDEVNVDDAAKLRAILTNMLENDGIFKP